MNGEDDEEDGEGYSDDYEEDDVGDTNRSDHRGDKQPRHEHYSTTSVVLGEDHDKYIERPDMQVQPGNVDGGVSVHSSRTLQMSLSDASLHVNQEEAVFPQSIGDGSLDKILFGSSKQGSSLYAVELSNSTMKGNGAGIVSLGDDPSYNISVDSSLLAGMNGTAAMASKGNSIASVSKLMPSPAPPAHPSTSSSRSLRSSGKKKKSKGSGPSGSSTSSQLRMSASSGGMEVKHTCTYIYSILMVILQLEEILGLVGSNGRSVGNISGTSQHKGFTVAGPEAKEKHGEAVSGGARRYWWDHLVDNEDTGPGMCIALSAQ